MDELKNVLVVNKDKTVPTIPRVAQAKGNVPTSDEFNDLVNIVNRMITQLRANGTLK